MTSGDGVEDWSRYAANGEVRLHYLDSGPGDPALLPLLFVPGFGEEAVEHRPFVEALRPRRVLVPDLRGRGRSSTPESGYRLEDHVADVDAVVTDAGIERLHVVSYSRGTGYALGWSVANPTRVASVTVGDYAAAQVVPPPWFGERARKGSWRGRPITDRMRPSAIDAMLADAVRVEMWEPLGAIGCPVLLIRGGSRGAIVDDDMEARYRAAIADLAVEHFESSGHDLWDPDPDRFAATVRRFVEEVEQRAAATGGPLRADERSEG